MLSLAFVTLVALEGAGEMVFLGVWALGIVVNVRDKGFLESLATSFIFFFQLEASSSSFLFRFSGD